MNIEEIEKAYTSFKNAKFNTFGFKFSLENFMEASINLHKDHIDRIAELEKMLGECLEKE